MKRIITLLLLLSSSLLSAYDSTTDSLARNILQAGTPASRLKAILAFCEENRTYSYDTLSKYAIMANQLAASVPDNNMKAQASFFIALHYYRNNQLDTVLQIADRALKLVPADRPHAPTIDKLKLLKASCLLKQNKHKAAVTMYYQVITEADKWGDTLNYIKGINGMGWVQMELGQHDAAKKWLHKGIAASNSEYVKIRTSILYTNLASCCGALKQLDSAKYYVEKGIALARKYNDLPVQANGLNILASYYMERNSFNEALTCVQESMQIRKILGDPYFIISDMAQFSYLLARTGKHKEAMDIIHNAISYASANKIESKLPLLYLVLSQNLYVQQDFKGSADALMLLQNLQDSLYHKASVKELAEMQVKYETSQKEQLIQKQQYELSRKNYLLYGSMALSLLIILLAIAIIRNRRNRQKVNLQQIILQQQDKATQSILAAEENERKRIASDLHDGLGQLLTAARFNLNGLSDNLRSLPQAEQQILAKAMSLVDESCREVRNVSHNIMPNALIKSGLGNAVKDFIDKIENKQLQVDLSTAGINEKIEANTEAVVYRIIQECVNNTIKHSGASKLHISIIHDEDGLNITIEDNGKGFDPAILLQEKGIGMKNIKTRTAYLKGTLDIDSRPDKGTLIAIHIPNKQRVA